jgi:hypothetical protein
MFSPSYPGVRVANTKLHSTLSGPQAGSDIIWKRKIHAAAAENRTQLCSLKQVTLLIKLSWLSINTYSFIMKLKGSRKLLYYSDKKLLPPSTLSTGTDTKIHKLIKYLLPDLEVFTTPNAKVCQWIQHWTGSSHLPHS